MLICDLCTGPHPTSTHLADPACNGGYIRGQAGYLELERKRAKPVPEAWIATQPRRGSGVGADSFRVTPTNIPEPIIY